MSAAGSDGGAWTGKPCDPAAATGRGAQAGDLVVLGGQARQGLGAEGGEFADRAVGAGQALLERGDLALEPGDLRVPRVGDLAGLLEGLESLLELLPEVGVGPGAVEGGAVDAGLAGQGLDVAAAPVRSSPRSSRSMAARIRCWFAWRWRR
jgi:hypothetical protein